MNDGSCLAALPGQDPSPALTRAPIGMKLIF
jgi:hypothetical protein